MPVIHTADPDSWESYLAQQGLAESTQRLYGAIGRRWIETERSPREVIQEAIDNSPDGRLPPGTANTYQGALAHWERFTGRKLNPPMRLPVRKGREAVQQRHLERSQRDRYLEALYAERAALTPVVANLLLFLPESGLRISEACGLRWDQIDQPPGSNAVAWVTVTGKGGRERLIPLTRRGKQLLAAFRRSKRNPEWVFPSRSGYGIRNKRPVTANHVRERWAAVRDKYDLGAVSPHWLRHTYATGLREAGVEIADIQALLGHKDIKTTLRYAKPTRAGLQRAVSKLGRGD